MTSLYRRFKIWLFGGTGTLSGAYAEASVSAMERATNFKERRKK